MKNWFTLGLLFSPIFLFSQKIMVSEDLPLRNDIAYELIGEMKGHMLLFRDQSTEFEVQAFDENMRLSWSKPVELDRKQPKVLGLASQNDRFTLLYRTRKKGDTILKAHKYDGAANMVDSVTIKNYGYLFHTPNYETIRSEDDSKLMVYYIEKQTDVNVLVFDVDSMQLLWERVFQPRDFSFYEDFREIIVDNSGNMHLILDKDNIKAKKKTHYYEILEYYYKDEMTITYNIPLEGNLTYDAYFSYDDLNKRLIAGGLYSEKSPARATGYFYLKIDPLKHADHLLSFQPFDDEFISALEGKDIKENKGLAEVMIQETVLRRDGGILMIGERTKELERRVAGTSRVTYDGARNFIVDYYYDELFVISVHPTGQTHWKTILHKKQYSQDDDGIYSSYFLFKTPSSLRFLFNDEIRYENTVSEYVINARGDFDRNSLLSTENLQLRLRFRDAVQLDSDELVVPSERRNKLKLVKMEY